jgi:hypothetical protein
MYEKFGIYNRLSNDPVVNTREQFAGSFGIEAHNGNYELYDLDDFDAKHNNGVVLKEDEKLFRYETDSTRIGKMSPLVKVNTKKYLVYFLKDMDSDVVVFNTKGIKMRYFNEIDKSKK